MSVVLVKIDGIYWKKSVVPMYFMGSNEKWNLKLNKTLVPVKFTESIEKILEQ